jgi:hypothetical protein
MKNLPRWIAASANKHFADIAAANNIPYFVEGIDEREGSDMRQSHSEMRVTGPFIKEVSKDYYLADVVINIMLTELLEMTATNAYLIHTWAGVFSAEMLEPIPVYKYGDGPDDDDSLIGCLRVKDGRYDAIKVFHFGQINGTDRLRQSEVDGLFDIEITGSSL